MLKYLFHDRIRDYLLYPTDRAFALSSGRAKLVRCVETGEEYPSQNAAEKATGMRGIHKACSGIQTGCGGYHWLYIKSRPQYEACGISG